MYTWRLTATVRAQEAADVLTNAAVECSAIFGKVDGTAGKTFTLGTGYIDSVGPSQGGPHNLGEVEIVAHGWVSTTP